MKNKGTIILIPGFKGSVLRMTNGLVIWPNLIKAHFGEKLSLALPLPKENPENTIHLKSDDIVRDVKIISDFLKQDVYGYFLSSLRQHVPSNIEIIPFHYDWREELEEPITRLNELIEKLSQNQQGPIDLISHSMGGLITARMLQMTSSNLIRHVFFVGTPFKGTNKVLVDLEYGSRFGLNSCLLSPKALGSFPSVYYLLPQYEGATGADDIYDINIWTKYEVGYLVKHSQPSFSAYLQEQLKKSQNFWQQLVSFEGNFPSSLQLTFVNNRTHKTIEQLQLSSGMKISWGKGDSVVSNISLDSPNFFRNVPQKHFSILKTHRYCFAGDELVKIVLERLGYTKPNKIS